MKSESLSDINRNRCPLSIGMTVRYESEWVSDERRNMHLDLPTGMKSEKCDIGLNPKHWDDYMNFLKGNGWCVEATGDSQAPGIGTPRYVARDANGAEIVLWGNGLVSRKPSGRTFIEEFRRHTATPQVASNNNKRSKKAEKRPCDCDLETVAEEELMRAEQEFRVVRKKAGLSVAKIAKITGVHPETIKDFEVGAGPLTFREFMHILTTVGGRFSITQK